MTSSWCLRTVKCIFLNIYLKRKEIFFYFLTLFCWTSVKDQPLLDCFWDIIRDWERLQRTTTLPGILRGMHNMIKKISRKALYCASLFTNQRYKSHIKVCECSRLELRVRAIDNGITYGVWSCSNTDHIYKWWVITRFR